MLAFAVILHRADLNAFFNFESFINLLSATTKMASKHYLMHVHYYKLIYINSQEKLKFRTIYKTKILFLNFK